MPSYTTIDGKYALRASVTNHRSRQGDFDILVRQVLKLGEDLVHGYTADDAIGS